MTTRWRAIIAALTAILTVLLVAHQAGAESVTGELLLDPQPTTPPPSGMGVVTGLAYIGLYTAVGVPWFRAFVVKRMDPMSMRIAYLAGGVTVIAHILMSVITRIWEQDKPISAITHASSWKIDAGHGTIRALVFVAIGLSLELLFAERDLRQRFNRLVVFGGGLFALGALTVVGHTATLKPAWVAHGADFAHGLCGAIWIGGIIGLSRYLTSRDPEASRTEGIEVIRRFSTVALISVLILASSGVTMAWHLLPAWDHLWTTFYGRLILLKLAILLVPLAMAIWNRVRLVPAVASTESDDDAWSTLRRAVTIEAMALLVVLLVTGFMVLQNPAT